MLLVYSNIYSEIYLLPTESACSDLTRMFRLSASDGTYCFPSPESRWSE